MAYAVQLIDDGNRKDDIVYFSGDVSSQSWAGTIADEHDMSDAEVTSYVEKTNPKLFAKLHGMRHGSSDLPMSYKPMHDLRRLDDMAPRAHGATSMVSTSSAPTRTSNFFATSHSANENALRDLLRKVKTPLDHPKVQYGTHGDQCEVQDQLKLDGVSHENILSAAERLYPKIAPARSTATSVRQKDVQQDSAFLHPTNSKRALQLRALKQLETNEILAEVSKYEKGLRAANSQLRNSNIRETSPDASVLITRPSYMESKEYRYKKQGLTEYDKRKSRRDQPDLKNPPNSPFKPPKFVKDPQAPRAKIYYCYCREEEDGREMIRCSKEWCPVGWFHLDCTGLDRLPYLNEEFHCCYCSDGLGHLVTEAALDGPSKGDNDVPGKLAESVAHHYLHNEIETNIEFVEEDFGQRRTNAFGKFSIYDDEEEEDSELSHDDHGEESWGQNDHARLCAKIVKWQAVNNPQQKGKGLNTSSPAGENSDVDSVCSVFEDDSDEYYSGDEEMEGVVSDVSTIRASSQTAAHPDAATKSGIEVTCLNKRDSSGSAAITNHSNGSTSTSHNGSSIVYSQLSYPSKFLAINTPISTSAKSTTTSQPAYPPQPPTMTDSNPRNHDANTRSTLSSVRSGLPSHLTSFHDHNKTATPRTPLLAPRVGNIPTKSTKPWGTPVNIKEYESKYKYNFGPIDQPSSPSPAGKRKFAKMNEGLDGDDEEEDYEEEFEQENETEHKGTYMEEYDIEEQE